VSRSLQLLVWCTGIGLVVQYLLSGSMQPVPPGFSAIFWYLIKVFDPLGNILLLLVIAIAFALRDRPLARELVLRIGGHPWRLAALAFPTLCLGALWFYEATPLSMDEYSVVFQAKAFAAGRLSGELPPQLIDQLVPRGFHGLFFAVSRASGEVASVYWPGAALLLAPFEALGLPWALNPALAALSVPVIHRLALRVSGSAEAAAWAALFTLASPAFIVNGLSFYSMTAHLLLNALYALLLLAPTPQRAFVAGLLGALALVLHNPLPHILFALPFLVWLLWRGSPARTLAALMAGYIVPVAVLGLGWKLYLQQLAAGAASSGPAPEAGGAGLVDRIVRLIFDQLAIFRLPTARVLDARFAGFTKAWTWGAAGLIVLAAWAVAALHARAGVRLLAAALLTTFLGYFAIRFDQGHGWGYRYLHSAWFALPILAGVAVAHLAEKPGGAHLGSMAGWALVLSMVFANGLRLAQVDTFVEQQLAQVPPLAAGPGARPEVVFVQPRAGFYAIDRVQNDPYLRGNRIIMLGAVPSETAAVMARHFPGYIKIAGGSWGEHWVLPAGREDKRMVEQ